MYDPSDNDLVVLLAGCSLATSPGDKDNWVERTGSGGSGGKLPNYICRIARAIMRSGKGRSQAISIAVSRVKVWAAGGDDVTAKTRAKAAKAVAQWEAMKAKNKAKKVVKATNPDGSFTLLLAQEGMSSFDVDRVRNAWYEMHRPKGSESSYAATEPMSPTDTGYVKSLWSDFIIVEFGNGSLFKVAYEVRDNTILFGTPKAVRIEYVPVSEAEWDDEWSGDFFDDDDEEDDECGVELEDDELLALGLGRLIPENW